jgi:large subunit ribosomal protein L2
MATVIKRKPTSPGRRFVVSVVDNDLHKGKPFAALTESKNRINGRNNRGKITVRHRGGGHKQRYRIIDFKRDKFDVLGRVETIEYDPNRSAYITLIVYAERLGSYSIVSTLPKTSNLSLLKSIIRYLRRCPPPLCLHVILP